MPKQPGDISHIFESPVPNLDWLDVDEKAYRDVEKLPNQNLDAVPDLVDAWTHHDKGTTRLIPNISPDVSNDTPWQDHNKRGAIDPDQLSATVERSLKERMMMGWDNSRLAEWVRDNVPAEHIPAMEPTLRKVAGEGSLLGNVYIDVTHWPECDRGQGLEIATQSRHAKYALGDESKCSGCIHNQAGRCSVFQRDLTFDVVPYDESLVDEYSNKLKVPRSSVTASDNPKEQLRSIFRASKQANQVVPTTDDLKPTITEGNQTARDRRANRLYEPPDTQFQSTKERALYRDLSKKMMASEGRLSAEVSRRFAAADSEALDVLGREKNILGRLYLRPDQFDNCHQANDYFRRHKVTASKLLEIPNKCSGCQFFRASTSRCSLMGKDVVREIEYTPELLSNELNSLVASGQLSQSDAGSYIGRAATEDLHDLLSEAMGTSSSRQSIYEPKYDVEERSIHDAVSTVVTDSSTVPLKYASVVRGAYRAAYGGLHGISLRDHLIERYGRRAIVEAAEWVRPAARLSGLLGNVVLDMRGFRGASEARDFLKKYGMKPKYLLKEGCGCGGPGSAPDYAKQFPGLTLINIGDIGEIEIESVGPAIDEMEMNRGINPHKASELRSKIGSSNGWDILQEAYLSPPPAPVAGPERPSTPLLQIDLPVQPVVDPSVAVTETTDTGPKGYSVTATARVTLQRGIKRALNEGLYGDDLKRWIRNGYHPKLISDQSDFIRSALTEQGLAGHHYIDPTPYDHCKDGAKHVSSSKAVYVREMPKCSGCVYRTANNRCQIYNRDVVSEVPYEGGKRAAQDRILHPTYNPDVAPTNDPALEFGLVGSLGVEVGKKQSSPDLNVGFDEVLGDIE